jgi:hypothetical protein
MGRSTITTPSRTAEPHRIPDQGLPRCSIGAHVRTFVPAPEPRLTHPSSLLPLADLNVLPLLLHRIGSRIGNSFKRTHAQGRRFHKHERCRARGESRSESARVSYFFSSFVGSNVGGTSNSPSSK